MIHSIFLKNKYRQKLHVLIPFIYSLFECMYKVIIECMYKVIIQTIMLYLSPIIHFYEHVKNQIYFVTKRVENVNKYCISLPLALHPVLTCQINQ